MSHVYPVVLPPNTLFVLLNRFWCLRWLLIVSQPALNHRIVVKKMKRISCGVVMLHSFVRQECSTTILVEVTVCQTTQQCLVCCLGCGK